MGTQSFGSDWMAIKRLRRIRNYMSKPWFIKAATRSVESPLSRVIKNALGGPDPNLEQVRETAKHETVGLARM